MAVPSISHSVNVQNKISKRLIHSVSAFPGNRIADMDKLRAQSH